MWESIKNDPILKTVSVIVLGVLAFGFAFNVMFGSSGGMGHGMDAGGTPLNAYLVNALSILIKIFLIVFTVTAIVVVVKQLKKYLSGDNSEKISDTFKKYTANKWIVAGACLFLLIVIMHLIIGTGIRPYGNNMMTGGQYYPMQGYGYNTGISGMLSGLVNILLLISVVGLAAGLFMYFKTDK